MPRISQSRQNQQGRLGGPPLDFIHNYRRHNTAIPAGGYQEIGYWGYRNGAVLQYRPDTPANILRDAFNEYIVNENIESNTLGIEIVYLENEGDTTAKNITIIKRKYQSQPVQTRRANVNNANEHYLDINDIAQSANFPNSQLTNLTIQIQSVYRILQITLCEIYNDDPVSISRRGTTRRNYVRGYRPFTIPIKLLYRDIDQSTIPPQRFYSWQAGYVAPEITPEEQAIVDQREQQQQESVIAWRAARQAEQEALLTQQQAERQQEQTPEQMNALLNDPFFNNYENLGQSANAVNPDPLQVVNNQELLNRPITSYNWPGMCQICQMGNVDEPLCRVDCKQRDNRGVLVPIGHVFHCECINAYRNTRTEYGWNNKCPICVQRGDPVITSMVNLTPVRIEHLPSSFGKKQKISSEIKYLCSLK